MSEPVSLPRSLGGAPTYRRDHRKADGRMLHLYGRTSHDLPLQPESADEIAQGGEIRHHPLRNEWNVYAAHRQNRTFKPSAADDPLAPTRPDGPETEIPFSDFELAIFENKFAAFHPSAANAAELAGITSEPAKGACDVVVYGPETTGNLHSIGGDRRQVLIAALIDRYQTLFDAGCRYVLPFENRGDEVGVTLHHPHGQIYGFERVPEIQQRAIDAFADGYDLASEITAALPDYGLGETGGVAAFVPRFARFPYEVWIAPRIRREGPWDCSDEELEGLAYWLGEVTRRYDALFRQPAATMMAFHAAPAGGSENYHFTVQFYPLLRAPGRQKYLASVEQHTGTFTVDVMPESAVAALREHEK
ncbi:galactose-1-phosphate uridylyltransferase [Erythrobacter sp. F6033]|uniref:galactose-1-phosphate uridylyltransferase n=1 Tax=Erythrobacter sp. F6033 TaxID=2926401 RepID=UPI001FF4EC8A|nr:galactose-1-phosphate uridylyltransferase [Erythrobacter sp. F6033]MCK0127751.1 galactose-1-phosphate uridylyltransferase [Erythrobacter sp. F6033]